MKKTLAFILAALLLCSCAGKTEGPQSTDTGTKETTETTVSDMTEADTGNEPEDPLSKPAVMFGQFSLSYAQFKYLFYDNMSARFPVGNDFTDEDIAEVYGQTLDMVKNGFYKLGFAVESGMDLGNTGIDYEISGDVRPDSVYLPEGVTLDDVVKVNNVFMLLNSVFELEGTKNFAEQINEIRGEYMEEHGKELFAVQNYFVFTPSDTADIRKALKDKKNKGKDLLEIVRDSFAEKGTYIESMAFTNGASNKAILDFENEGDFAFVSNDDGKEILVIFNEAGVKDKRYVKRPSVLSGEIKDAFLSKLSELKTDDNPFSLSDGAEQFLSEYADVIGDYNTVGSMLEGTNKVIDYIALDMDWDLGDEGGRYFYVMIGDEILVGLRTKTGRDSLLTEKCLEKVINDGVKKMSETYETIVDGELESFKLQKDEIKTYIKRRAQR